MLEADQVPASCPADSVSAVGVGCGWLVQTTFQLFFTRIDIVIGVCNRRSGDYLEFHI